MLLGIILASCLTLGHTTRHEHNQYEPIYNGIITDIALETFNCSNYNDICYYPSFTVLLQEQGNKTLLFGNDCQDSINCVTTFFNIKNPIKIKYYQSTNTYDVLRPGPKKTTDNLIYIILSVIMITTIFICISYVKIVGINNSSSPSSELEIPPMYTENEYESTHNELPQYALNESINTDENETDTNEEQKNDEDNISITSTTLLIWLFKDII